MPRTLQIEAPDGRRFEIEAPDDATDEQIEAVARQASGVGDSYPVANRTQQPVQASMVDPDAALLSDIGTGVREIGTGVLEGAATVADQAANWLQSGLNAAGEAVTGRRWGDEINSLGGSDGTNNLAGAVPQATPGLEFLRGGGKVIGEGAGLAALAPLGGGALVQGALGGALLSKSDTLGGVALDAGLGALGGRAGEALLGGAANVARPQLDPRVRRLVDQGVELTTGQMSGVARPLKRLEDIAASVPLVQTPVADAQRAATESLNRVATRRTLTPIGEADLLDNVEVGHEAVAFAGDRLRQAYADVLPRLNGTLDGQFGRRVDAIRQRANLPPEYDEQLANVTRELGNAFTRGPRGNGAFTGRTLRDASERLEDLASAWRRNDDPYLRQLGDVAEQYRQQLHALARRQNPAEAARLRSIDRGYASLVRVEKAAAGTADGVFSPAQYDQAVRSADRTVRRRQSARGQALDQDLSSDARLVMQNTAAQGGSKDVNSLAALYGLGAGALLGAPAAIAGGAGIIAGRQLYRPGAQAAIRGAMSAQPGPARDALGRLLAAGAAVSPYGAPALIDTSR